MPNTQLTDGVSVLIKHKWKIVLAVIILLVAAMFVNIIFPLLDGIIMGVVLAYVARPLKNFFDRYTPGISPYLATAAIVVPIFLIIGLGIIEIFNLILWAIKNQDYVVGVLLRFVDRLDLPEFARNKMDDIISNFTDYLLPFIKQLPVGQIVKSLAIIILNILIAIILCFYLLVDGGRLVDRMLDIIPDEIEGFMRKFLKHFDGILSALFIGNIYSAIAVGILSLIVFWAFGFPNVLALSALMLVAAIVPFFAGWMVIIPLGIYRYFEMGTQSAAIFLTVSLLILIIPPELLIRPYIIKTRSNIHPMLIIIAFLGGGLVGGIAGFFIAPILLGAIVSAYRANEELRREALKQAGRSS
ncbi:MAG: AI-2E family transporter [Candidatus Methanoperedens sp.]|nr:AI-2E family transporter [Candidatus Methanoperedens sp.]MCZ7371411.1 AI-2E family transporter [Candidatus Methanoperedens sp.]